MAENSSVRSAIRMNTVITMFLDLTAKVSEVVEKGVIIHDIFMPVSPLANLAAKVVISNMSAIELSWFGQLVSPITMFTWVQIGQT